MLCWAVVPHGIGIATIRGNKDTLSGIIVLSN